MEAFKEGFESVFPITNLKIFYPEELEQVFCGSSSGKFINIFISYQKEVELCVSFTYMGDDRSNSVL